MTMASDDKSLKLERISSKRMLIILRDYEGRRKALRFNQDEFGRIRDNEG